MEFKNTLIMNKYKEPKYNVLFLHGFISSYKIFEKITNEIPLEEINYYAFDYFNTDESNTKPKMKFDKLYEQVVAFVEEYKLDNIVLVGHSMGGGVVSEVYSHLKDKVKKVILLSPLSKAVLTSKVGLTFFSATIFNNLKKLRDTLYSSKNTKNKYSTDPLIFEDYESFFKEKTKHIELGMSLISISRLNRVMKGYSKIICPTLILLGANDKIIPGKVAKEEFAKLKKDNFEVILWNDVGHVTWIENFDEFKTLYTNFLLEEKETEESKE